MYVVTFYSFKGGVGRTLALVNVACELVRRGQRVLMIDFDLEAPGISTFPLLVPPRRSRTSHPGLVDLVGNYLATGRAPDVSDYIYRVKLRKNLPGQLFVLPAGANDHFYRERLQAINWVELYEKHDGYLLFEEVKITDSQTT